METEEDKGKQHKSDSDTEMQHFHQLLLTDSESVGQTSNASNKDNQMLSNRLYIFISEKNW